MLPVAMEDASGTDRGFGLMGTGLRIGTGICSVMAQTPFRLSLTLHSHPISPKRHEYFSARCSNLQSAQRARALSLHSHTQLIPLS